jgi:DNA repair exonuclease SbcCD ATPase subunit
MQSRKENIDQPSFSASEETRHAAPSMSIELGAKLFDTEKLVEQLRAALLDEQQKAFDQINSLCKSIIELRASLEERTQQLEEAQAKIAESAFNCPSCGRHDFGLMAGPIQRVRELETQLRAAEATLKQRDAYIAELRAPEELPKKWRRVADEGYETCRLSPDQIEMLREHADELELVLGAMFLPLAMLCALLASQQIGLAEKQAILDRLTSPAAKEPQ